MRGAVRNKERWKGRRAPTQYPSTHHLLSRTGSFNASLDGIVWLASTPTPASWFGSSPKLGSVSHVGGVGDGVTVVELRWHDGSTGEPLPWVTSLVAGESAPGSIILRQTFPSGIADTAKGWAPSAASTTCGAVQAGTDQTGGEMCCGTPNASHPAGFRRYTEAQCCAGLQNLGAENGF